MTFTRISIIAPIFKILIFFTLLGVGILLYFTFVPYSLAFCTFPTIYYQGMCTLFYFSYLIYVLLIVSSLLYILPNIMMFTRTNETLRNYMFNTLTLRETAKFIYTFPALILVYHSLWISPVLTLWFGHLTFTALQFKVLYLVSVMFITYLISLCNVTHLSSRLIYDYVITLFHLWVWLWVLFFTNNLFSLIFFVELLSISVTLLLVTSVFTSSHFYNLTSYTTHTYFQHSYPTTLLHTLVTFFWMTLVSSLLLFLFLLIFHVLILTFDLSLINSLFMFLTSSSETVLITSLSLTWFMFLLCIFIKGGIVPFFVWKPSFFKGISYLALFFYIYVYYFTLFLYFIYCIFFILNELLLFYIYLLIGLVSLGAIIMSSILFESFYIKSFFALSSILNSLIIFFAVASLDSCTGTFMYLG